MICSLQNTDGLSLQDRCLRYGIEQSRNGGGIVGKVSFHTRALCLCALDTKPFCVTVCAEMRSSMISNQVLQTTIDGLKNITRVDICVMDIEGKALATTINNIEEY